MADERLFNPATRWYLAFKEAFADFTQPTAAELNANPTNDLEGLIFNITCALDQDGSQFDLGDSETDDSLSFCQVAGAQNRTTENPEIAYQIFRSKDPLEQNTANLAFSLMAWKGVEMVGIMSVGEEPTEEFSVGDRVKMATIAFDYPSDVIGTGEMVRLAQDTANRGSVNWNYEVAA